MSDYNRGLPAPGAGGYLTVEDLEWKQERLQQEQMKVQQQQEKRTKEIRALRALARPGVHSPWQGMAFRALQKKYLAEWNRIRWG